MITYSSDRSLVSRPEAGGHGVLFWVVDGTPLDRAKAEGRQAHWAPQGPGYSRITVIDAEGKSASSLVKLVSER